MKKNTRTGSRLFFIEFLIVLFFFLIVSTVCLRLFSRAHVITQRADDLSHAQTAAASVAAAIEDAVAIPGNPDEPAGAAVSGITAILDKAAVFLPEAEVSQDRLILSYDDKFQPCGSRESAYTLTATITQDDGSRDNSSQNRDRRDSSSQNRDSRTSSSQDNSSQNRDSRTGSRPADAPRDLYSGHDFSLAVTVSDNRRQTIIYELLTSFHRPLTRKEALQP